MSSPIGSVRNVKIFVLYLMQNIGIPLDYIAIGEMVMVTDYVAYLDLAEAFHEMVDDGLIEQVALSEAGDPAYVPTKKGMVVAESLRSDLLTSVLDQSLATALRYMDFKKRGVKISCRTEKAPTGGYHIHCLVKEKECILLEITLWVDSQSRASRMENQFRDRPESIYRSVNALLSGNVNYLLDQ